MTQVTHNWGLLVRTDLLAQGLFRSDRWGVLVRNDLLHQDWPWWSYNPGYMYPATAIPAQYITPAKENQPPRHRMNDILYDPYATSVGCDLLEVSRRLHQLRAYLYDLLARIFRSTCAQRIDNHIATFRRTMKPVGLWKIPYRIVKHHRIPLGELHMSLMHNIRVRARAMVWICSLMAVPQVSQTPSR